MKKRTFDDRVQDQAKSWRLAPPDKDYVIGCRGLLSNEQLARRALSWEKHGLPPAFYAPGADEGREAAEDLLLRRAEAREKGLPVPVR
jgi:hypothetical protein